MLTYFTFQQHLLIVYIYIKFISVWRLVKNLQNEKISENVCLKWLFDFSPLTCYDRDSAMWKYAFVTGKVILYLGYVHRKCKLQVVDDVCILSLLAHVWFASFDKLTNTSSINVSNKVLICHNVTLCRVSNK